VTSETSESGLSSLNSRLSRRWVFWTSIVLIFAGATLFCVLPIASNGRLSYPPQRDDGPEYEAVAFSLWKGRGFVVDWDDPEFLAPYRRLAATGAYADLEARRGKGPTTYRPPLMPAIMAGTYWVFGRQFEPIRVINCLATAGSLVFAFALIFRQFGFFPAWIAAFAFLVWDPRPAFYAGLVLTESLACLLTVVLAWLLLRLARTGGRWAAVLAGICLGLLVLTRGLYTLFVPVLGGMIWLGFRAQAGDQAILSDDDPGRWPALDRKQRTTLLGLFLAGILLVSTPWMIRNCLVLGAVQPLGTMGTAYLPLGYSDAALYARGAWFDLDKARFFESVPVTGSNLENEKARARFGQSRAMDWIKQNPHLIPTLIVYKIWHLWRPYAMRDTLMLVCAIFGALLLRSTRYGVVCIVLLAANSLAVGLTWSVGIRFLVPLLPVQLMLAAPFAWAAVLTVSDWRSVVSERLGRR